MDRPAPSEPAREEGGEKGSRRPTVAHWLILLLVAFFVGPMYASNIWGYLQSRRYLTDAAFLNIRNVAALEASETREFVRGAENLVSSIIAGNHFLYNVVRLLQDPTEDRVRLATSLHGHLAAKMAEGSSTQEFHVLNAGGRLLASSESNWVLDADLSSGRCFQRGFYGFTVVGFEYEDERPGADSHGHTGGHSDGHDTPHSEAGGSDHAPQLLVAAPIRESGGSLIGVFCARFDFDIHRALLLAHKVRTRHAMLYLVNESGEVVCGSFEEIDGAPYGETLPWLERTGSKMGEAWERRYRGEDGSETIVAFAPVPVLKWGVVVSVPVKSALAGLEHLGRQAMAGSALLAVVLVLAAILSWRTFVIPLKELSSASEHMASGPPGQTVAPSGPYEIAELAKAFNRMSLALRESHETLESKIASRTLALNESREFLELLLDSIDQRVIVVNRDYEIIKANTAAVRMHGGELVGKRCHEAFDSLAAPPEDYPVRRTLESGQVASDERSQLTIRGREAVYVETYPIFDAEGHVESVVEIARVITAEKKMQVQLVYQEKMASFGQLAAGFAHEIGNPLAAIDSQLRMAQNDPKRVEQTLEIVRKHVGRMDRMLRRLVDFTRRKRDEVMLTSPNQIADDVAQLLEHDPRARSITIERRLAENVPGIRAKEDDLVQVLLNLGLNALDAIDKSGTVEFETGVEGRDVIFRVRDTGRGVSPSARPHLFEPFFTTKGSDRGTGLGLFVSKGIIEAIGGELELESSGSEGTTFVIRFPVRGAGLAGDGV